MDSGKRENPGTQVSTGGPLRALTYLAPGIPIGFFERVTEHLARELSCAVELSMEGRSSGPMHGDDDPFADDRADIGFLCSPSYLYLRAQEQPSVELVPAAFVFDDPRTDGQPVYFSEVVVRTDNAAREFVDLAGRVWGYNDECSLSGYFSALQKLNELGYDSGFFERGVRTGSHHESIEALLSDAIDGAAIDSTVLATILREQPEMRARLRVLESWGPFPIQPVVVSSRLGSPAAARIAAALLTLERDSQLSAFGFERCAPIDDAAYAEERRALCALGQLDS